MEVQDQGGGCLVPGEAFIPGLLTAPTSHHVLVWPFPGVHKAHEAADPS